MSQALIDMLLRDTDCARVDGRSLDQFLAAPGAAVLFVAGFNAKRSETGDVAVVLRELLLDFPGRLRGALVAAETEPTVQTRFKAPVVPCLIVLRDGEAVAKLSGIKDWDDYVRAVKDAVGTRADA